ncbi:D-alanyl-D-alanine carboxypeptidase family protein [Fusobacterium sp. PH5-44]|uniref:D-alanyl-D-alanine carboxypeptidase family protein n=1 Tax=unclassified Fusobacterium TaxID=2648384 RepID=UPI003D237F33
MKKIKNMLIMIFVLGVLSNNSLFANKIVPKKKVQGKTISMPKEIKLAIPEGTENDSESGETEVVLDKPINECFAILVGDEDGNIMISEKIREKWPLASVTKMMTLLVTYDEIKKGKVKLTDKVTISKAVAAVAGSKVPLKVGDKISLEDLMKASGIHSANNATYAIANHVGGSTANFVKMMNQKAKSLGLSSELEFYTPAGLPSHMTKAKNDMGTAYGIYKLSLEYSKNQKLMSIASTKNTTINGGKIKIKNRNNLLGKEGIYGIKTGYHSKAGFNIAVVSEKEGRKIFTIVFGGKTVKGRDAIALNQIENAKIAQVEKTIVDKNVPLVKIPVIKGEKEQIDLYPTENFSKVVQDNNNINIQVRRIAKVVAPVKKDEVLGSYTVYIDDEKVYEGELRVKESVRLKL